MLKSAYSYCLIYIPAYLFVLHFVTYPLIYFLTFLYIYIYIYIYKIYIYIYIYTSFNYVIINLNGNVEWSSRENGAPLFGCLFGNSNLFKKDSGETPEAWSLRVMGANAPTFYQDGARDFFKH